MEVISMYSDAGFIGALAGILAAYAVLILVLVVLEIVGLWKMFAKAGEAGWKSLIPIYNVYILFKISMGNGWLFLLMLIPVVNIVISIIMLVKLCAAFGKGAGFTVGMIFFQTIFMMILGFGSAQYIGPNQPV